MELSDTKGLRKSSGRVAMQLSGMTIPVLSISICAGTTKARPGAKHEQRSASSDMAWKDATLSPPHPIADFQRYRASHPPATPRIMLRGYRVEVDNSVVCGRGVWPWTSALLPAHVRCCNRQANCEPSAPRFHIGGRCPPIRRKRTDAGRSGAMMSEEEGEEG